MNSPLVNNSEKPLVSVIIPFFDRQDFLSEAVQSVLAQTYENWELFLVDDGSTDKSLEIAQNFEKQYIGKIKLLSHPENQNKGPSASRNLGIKNAKGKYVTFLDSDDVYFPDALEKEVEAFAYNVDVDAVCGTLECWYSWSEEDNEWEKDFTIDLIVDLEKTYQPPDLLIHNLNAGGRKPGINCVMLKREFINKIGGVFEDDCRYLWEDQVFWSKLSLYGKIYVMDACLAKYRQHPHSSCAVETKDGKDIPTISVFLDWLTAYLKAENVTDKRVWKTLKSSRRTIYAETKLIWLKQLYRNSLPLYMRYRLRDKWTLMKRGLLRSSHRQK